MNKNRKPAVARLPVTFQAGKDHVVAVYQVSDGSTIDPKFTP